MQSNLPAPFPYVLFDLGSTLIYFDGSWPEVITQSVRAATNTLRFLGYEIDEQVFPTAYSALIDEYYQMREDTFIEYTAEYILRDALARHSIPTARAEDIQLALKNMFAVSQNHWHVEEDAASTLKALRASGRHLGIVSNAVDDTDVQTLVDKAEIRPYFDFILSSAAVGFRKPGPEIFSRALAYWDARPEQAIMVGDTLGADVLGANNLGIASVWISRRVDTPENRAALAAIKPGWVIDLLDQLLPVVGIL